MRESSRLCLSSLLSSQLELFRNKVTSRALRTQHDKVICVGASDTLFKTWGLVALQCCLGFCCTRKVKSTIVQSLSPWTL